jgi:hypothetical protein
MIFSLDVRRARKGDCLLLHFGTKQAPRLMLVDGGPKDVYKPFLRPRLVELRTARRLGPAEALPVDLLMISHIDDDHIQGILDLTREAIDTQNRQQPPLIRFMGMWHNSFDDIVGDVPSELAATASYGTAGLSRPVTDDDSLLGGSEDFVSGVMVLASYPQGRQLRLDAQKLGIPLNPDFGGKLVLAGDHAKPIGNDLKLTVIGPRAPELLALQRKHDAWLTQQRKKPKSQADALAAYVDKSVPNLSSIVVLAESSKKRILLTGDARGDKILNGLESVGILKPGGTIEVDVLKVPHHGSSNNLDVDFFQRIVAHHYVFSGNGEHGNPEREALEMLFAARGKAPLTIHLTYPVDEIDAARRAEWAQQRQREKDRGAATVRNTWSDPKQSLQRFLTGKRLAADQVVTIVDASRPHVIDLLDPLGY